MNFDKYMLYVTVTLIKYRIFSFSKVKFIDFINWHKNIQPY